MAMYELDGNHLLPVRLGRPTDAETRARGLAAIQRQVVDVLRRPLFPLGWSEVDHGQSLTALDATGQVVLVEVLSAVDAAGLMSAMSRLTAAAAAGRRELASRYAGGLAAFREDWNEFREAMPSQVESGPRLTLLAASLAPDVRSSMSVLMGSGVELYEVDTRVVDESRVVVVIEQVRMSDLSGGGPLLVARPQRPGLTGPGTRAAQAQQARPQPVTGSIEVVAPRQPADPGQGSAPPADYFRAEAVAEEQTAGTQTGTAGAADSTPVAGTAGVRDGAQGLQEEAEEPASRARGHRLRDTVAGTRTPGSSGWDGAAVGQHAAAPGASRHAGDGEEQAPVQPLTPPSVSTPPQDDTEAAHLAQAWPVSPPGRAAAQAEAEAVTRPTPEVAAQDAADLAAIARHLEGPTRIIWQGLRRGIYHEAVLSAGGIITLVDGRTFSDPTSAANAAQGVDDADGWRVWRLGVRGRQLGDLREDLRRSPS
ncbi:hypothetical protein D5R93_02505 [Actinomyces lilanjuaniae]|uniref:RAMA domain-containing protein n=1 Tax=Actinomyces lilanjuaniae TaxID=2321394 RepID=A0ABM6Z1Y7_9ACTO|nr:hypothetical protein [Actinomyces lilanjuaniae]AYD89211.1 hypothetical protein D5R93_02505 [Actinomyces lilanjuaniae]